MADTRLRCCHVLRLCSLLTAESTQHTFTIYCYKLLYETKNTLHHIVYGRSVQKQMFVTRSTNHPLEGMAINWLTGHIDSDITKIFAHLYVLHVLFSGIQIGIQLFFLIQCFGKMIK